MQLEDMGFKVMYWINLAQDKVQFQGVLNIELSLVFRKIRGFFWLDNLVVFK